LNPCQPWILIKDRFFDNVGGKQLDLGIQRIATLGKILACGAISTYERDEKIAISGASWMQIVSVPYFVLMRFWHVLT
jgi:NADPH-dependent curcumin reductase CurA